MYPLKKENGRLTKENNKLHLELIRKTEEQDETIVKWKEEVALLQKQIKDKEFKDTFREQTIAKCEKVYKYIHAYIHTRIHTCIHIHTHSYTYIHIYRK